MKRHSQVILSSNRSPIRSWLYISYVQDKIPTWMASAFDLELLLIVRQKSDVRVFPDSRVIFFSLQTVTKLRWWSWAGAIKTDIWFCLNTSCCRGGLQGYPCAHSSMLPAEISPSSFSLPLIRQGHACCVRAHFLQGFVSSRRKGQQFVRHNKSTVNALLMLCRGKGFFLSVQMD